MNLAATAIPISESQTRKLMNAELTRCLKLAELRFGRPFARPLVTFDLTGLRAGTANPGKWHIRLNPLYFRTHLRESLYETVPHELAHLIDCAIHPENYRKRSAIRGRKAGRRSFHGATWKRIMRLFGVTPKRCHRMSAPGLKRRITKWYDYQCPRCRSIVVVGPRHHKQFQEMQAQAKLTACGHLITGKDCLGLNRHTQKALAERTV